MRGGCSCFPPPLVPCPIFYDKAKARDLLACNRAFFGAVAETTVEHNSLPTVRDLRGRFDPFHWGNFPQGEKTGLLLFHARRSFPGGSAARRSNCVCDASAAGVLVNWAPERISHCRVAIRDVMSAKSFCHDNSPSWEIRDSLREFDPLERGWENPLCKGPALSRFNVPHNPGK